MRVALIGPRQSGKSILLAAVAEAGGSHVDLSRPDQPHRAVVKVPDPRVDWLAEQYRPKKVTYAELEFVDTPGYDLRDEAGRQHAKAHWPLVRQSHMLLPVVRAFDDATVPAYRDRVDPVADVEELLAELLFADLEQVTNRVEKLSESVRKPTPRRNEDQRELELMQRLQQTLEAERPVAEAVRTDAEEKLIRSFAFLSLKSLLVVVNSSEAQLDDPPPEMPAGLPAMRISAKIEEEIAELPADERAAFLADLGVSASARDVLIRACYERMNLVSFLTYGEDECRAWTVPAGTRAVEAAGEIHSDIARGFIRAETVAFDDLQAAGDIKSARAAGTLRLEGKDYVVADGDVITFRFNV
ncbi:MAG: YchF family ATPase [Phycisphaerae bacterium]|nr:YchF family ATPase [Phycisphaerae bacterium]